ncbi:MAG TPA: LytTR family DNA-binding domain-containing protein [Puia sp.]|nr:LytTR family DNA-binding domain-containing protein [Puia sp.]
MAELSGPAALKCGLFLAGKDFLIVTESGRILTLQTFQDLEAMLPREKLARVHKSFIVAIDKIQFIERNRIRIRDKLIPLSETYRESFFSAAGLKETKNPPF